MQKSNVAVAGVEGVRERSVEKSLGVMDWISGAIGAQRVWPG